MSSIFSDRITDVPRSFIREILKVTLDKSIISFAGGLPNRDLFPIDELQEATNRVLQNDPKDAFQYSSSEGYLPLREYISKRYYTGFKSIIKLLFPGLLNNGSRVREI